MTKKKRPHFREQTSDLRVRITAIHRHEIDMIAAIENTHLSQVVRNAITHYLALPEVRSILIEQCSQSAT